MPSSSHRAKSSGAKEQDSGIKKLFKSRVLWAIVGILGLLWGGVSTWSNTRISEALDEATDTGPPVEVSTEVAPPVGDVWLSEGVQLTPAQLGELDKMSLQEQHAWLADQGGTTLGWTELGLEVKGNRSDQVRIVDIRPVSECSPMDAGTLAAITPPTGAVPTTSRMTIEVEDPSKKPTWYDAEAMANGTFQGVIPFFDAQTITLNKDESEYILINLISEETLCTVNIELTYIEDGVRSKQKVFAAGEELSIAPRTWDAFLHKSPVVYMHSQMCEHFVTIPPDVFANLPWEAKCGTGNLRDTSGLPAVVSG